MRSVLIGFAALAAFGAMSTTAFAQDVRVTLTGVQARGGQLLGSLQTEGEFLQPRGSYGARAAAPAQNGSVTLVFTNVAPGAYSLSVMHDANSDMQMQRDPQGRPLEGWAMHNGAAVAAGQSHPTFAQVKFDVAAQNVSLTEAMIYPAP